MYINLSIFLVRSKQTQRPSLMLSRSSSVSKLRGCRSLSVGSSPPHNLCGSCHYDCSSSTTSGVESSDMFSPGSHGRMPSSSCSDCASSTNGAQSSPPGCRSSPPNTNSNAPTRLRHLKMKNQLHKNHSLGKNYFTSKNLKPCRFHKFSFSGILMKLL